MNMSVKASIWIFASIAGVIIFSLVMRSSTSGVAMPPPPESPESKVSIVRWEWDKGGFGTVMLARFSVHNSNPYAVKDIKIRCDLAGNSGTRIDSVQQTVFELIPANQTRTFEQVNMGFVRSQASKAVCGVASVTTLPY
jgi:hypothetical protein